MRTLAVEASTPADNNHDERNNRGTFHQHYRIDGRLVAVGVIDILSTGLSSVYAFYDPEFAHRICALGKYMILKEIEYCRDTLRLPYYYLGYYIHSCGKMRYKAEYYPSELLCPTHHKWVDAHEAQKILSRDSPEHHCCTLYTEGTDPTAAPVTANGTATTTLSSGPPMGQSSITLTPTQTLNRVPLIVGGPSAVTLPMLNTSGQDIVRPLLREFIDEVGSDVAARCTIRLV